MSDSIPQSLPVTEKIAQFVYEIGPQAGTVRSIGNKKYDPS